MPRIFVRTNEPDFRQVRTYQADWSQHHVSAQADKQRDGSWLTMVNVPGLGLIKPDEAEVLALAIMEAAAQARMLPEWTTSTEREAHAAQTLANFIASDSDHCHKCGRHHGTYSHEPWCPDYHAPDYTGGDRG